MTFSDFQELVNLSRQEIYQETYAENRETIRIKKEKTIVKNLAHILDAALRISNLKGFQAMSMRDLSRETGMSTGSLYAYFSSKEELAEILQSTGRAITLRLLRELSEEESTPRAKLRAAIRTHVYLSEVMRPWFYFSYMEARNLSKEERKKAISSELDTEKVFSDIISLGQEEGVFVRRDSRLAAGMIKAMVQDWYLKRWKYARRDVSVDRFADFVIDAVEAICLKRDQVDPNMEEEQEHELHRHSDTHENGRRTGCL
ncbi:MAG: TetR/AcrR family transcriptional regulator [Deltaproteobacteria bacterium]|nr:TetR/AcrR family transcriptional regulator [Deltaproteobacteria bacterium]